MDSRQKVGDAHVQCPFCLDIIDVPVYAEIVSDESSGGQTIKTDASASPLWTHYERHMTETSPEAAAIERAADWLEAQREQQWHGGERKINNYGRAATDLRRYAQEVREAATPEGGNEK